MKKLIAGVVALAAFCAVAAQIDVARIDTGTIATNTVSTTATTTVSANGRVVALVFSCTTNSTGTVATVTGKGLSAGGARTIAGPIVLASGVTTTNLAVPMYVWGESLSLKIDTLSALSGSANVQVVIEQ